MAPAVATPIPRASVIIVNTNELHHLKRCLPAVLDQDYGNYEVFVVDNASTDGSIEFLEQHFPNVTIVRSNANNGFGWANNLGAREADGEYLTFLNPDTVVEPGWLGSLVGALQAEPDAGLATSKVLQMDKPDTISGCGLELHCTGLSFARGMGMSRDAFTDVEEVSVVSGASFVVRKDVFTAIGGFDGDIFLYMEDTDLSLRASLAGYKHLFAPQSVVYHDYALHFGPKKTRYQERHRYLMLLKSLRWRTLLILSPALVLAEAVTWGFVLLREKRHLRNKLDAYRWVLTHWPRIMEKRRLVQRARRARDRDLLRLMTHRLAYEQTGPGALTVLARLVFDPLFFLCHRFALLAVWW